MPSRPLKVFLCHAHADRDPVRGLYTRLTQDGVDAWLDKAKLLSGQDWELEIRKAVREADVVVVCLSKQFNQAGFRQKEVKWALDTAMEKPEREIFIIPARLEECDTLESLRKWHWVDYFEDDGYEKILSALKARAKNIGATLQPQLQQPQDKDVAPSNFSVQETGAKKNLLINKFSVAAAFLLVIFAYFSSVIFSPNKNIVDVTQTPYIIYVYVTQDATQTTPQNVLCDGIVVKSTNSSKGVELEIKDCEGKTYIVGPLPNGVYKLSPNQKFIVYVAYDYDGSVYISKIGSTVIERIGRLRQDHKFSALFKSEPPTYNLTLTDTLLTIYEELFKESASYYIPSKYSR